MNDSELIQALHQASAFDPCQMREAVHRVLEEPRWISAIQSHLKVGQYVEYFEPQANAPKKGKFLELRQKQAVISKFGDAKEWLVSCAAIHLDGADVRINEKPLPCHAAKYRPSTMAGGLPVFAPRDGCAKAGRGRGRGRD